MEPEPTSRERAAARLLEQYQSAGNGFDGIHQMLLPHLRENRHAEPRPKDTAALAAAVYRLGYLDYARPHISWPNFVVDASVLASHARLDSLTVGAALVEAVADDTCQVIASPQAYLHVAPGLTGEQDQRLYRFLRHLEPATETREKPEDSRPAIEVPPLTFRHTDIIARLKTGERPDIVHTALLALHHRCVIGTFDPAAYHRLGYLRTLDLNA
ncbi:hypothetical protein [Actinoplanes sp. NPDC048796]|uniref:hypothetical protein n=1 Tax=Actinoplanes sp. NPDC048796 TaxID=3155640 RepID=UPI0034092FE5